MLKPKKLNLNKIWKLYLLLKPALDNREFEDVFIDEIEKLLLSSPSGTLFECLDILYDNRYRKLKLEGKKYIAMFVEGLIINSFYNFVDFVKDIGDDSSRKSR